MRGAYTLVIDLHEDLFFTLKSLGNLNFQRGTWVYVGSAMGRGSTSLENRIKRHFRKEKVIHWHIDHLLNSDSRIKSAIFAESNTKVECTLAQRIEELDGIVPGPKGFGASDCTQGCFTHLFYSKTTKIEEAIMTTFEQLNLNPRKTQDGNIEETT